MPRSKKNKRAAGNAGSEATGADKLEQDTVVMDEHAVEECSGEDIVASKTNQPSSENGGKFESFFCDMCSK